MYNILHIICINMNHDEETVENLVLLVHITQM